MNTGGLATTNAFGIQQIFYRFQEEDGNEATATLLGSENAALSRLVASNSNIQLRICCAEVGGGSIAGAANAVWQLQRKINAGAFANVTTSSTAARVNTASALTDGGATTERLTSLGTYHAGKQDDQDGAVIHTHTANLDTEHVFGLTLIAADLADGDVLTFQLLYNGALFTTTQNGAYTVTPTLNITKTVVVNFTGTPSTASTTATGLAPTPSAGHTLEPAAAAAVITGLAPTVAAHFTAEPAVAALALTGFAPDVPQGLTERLTPSAVLASTNLQDSALNAPPQLLTDIDEETGSPDGLWWTAIDPEADIDIRLSFPPTSGNLVGTNRIRVRIRGTSLPSRDWRLDLWESGSEKVPTATGTVTSIVGEVVEMAFAPTDVADITGNGVEVRIRGLVTPVAPENIVTITAYAIGVPA